MENTVTINGMDDVVSTLQRLLDSPDTDVSYGIDVQNLPDFELYLKGEKFDNSITPSIMKGVIELQKSIYRAYLIARYGSDNLQMLNNYERSALELRVIVQPGSTDLIAKMCDVAIKLFELINGMENRQKYIIILTVLAIIGSGVGWMFFDSYLKHEATKLDMSKELLIERERTKQLLETQKNTIDAVQMAIKSQHITDNTEVPQSNPLNNEEEVPVVEEETPPNNTAATNNENKAVHFKQLKKTDVELIAVIEKAKNFDEKVELASARTEESMRKLMASTASADFVRFNNQFEASGNTMQQIASTEKVESEDITIRKLFRVLNIDSKSTEFMQARLRPNDQSYPDFNAAFSDNSISQEKLDRLTTALTSYHPIDLSITAKKKRGKLDKAFIAQVRNIDTTKSFKQQTEESTDV